jgi:hypothetical protein
MNQRRYLRRPAHQRERRFKPVDLRVDLDRHRRAARPMIDERLVKPREFNFCQL